jgi:hypothetical protein
MLDYVVLDGRMLQALGSALRAAAPTAGAGVAVDITSSTIPNANLILTVHCKVFAGSQGFSGVYKLNSCFHAAGTRLVTADFAGCGYLVRADLLRREQRPACDSEPGSDSGGGHAATALIAFDGVPCGPRRATPSEAEAGGFLFLVNGDRC